MSVTWFEPTFLTDARGELCEVLALDLLVAARSATLGDPLPLGVSRHYQA